MEIRNGNIPPSIYILFNQTTGRTHRLINGLNVAGRCPPSEVHICLRALIASRRHAELFVSEDRTVSIYDVGSENGTFINFQRIPCNIETPIIEHDIIGFGMCQTLPNELAPGQEVPVFTLEKLALTPPTTPAESTDASSSSVTSRSTSASPLSTESAPDEREGEGEENKQQQQQGGESDAETELEDSITDEEDGQFAQNIPVPLSPHSNPPNDFSNNNNNTLISAQSASQETDDKLVAQEVIYHGTTNNNMTILDHSIVESANEIDVQVEQESTSMALEESVSKQSETAVAEEEVNNPSITLNKVPTVTSESLGETESLENAMETEDEAETNTNNDQQRRQNLIEIDYSRVKIEECIIEIEDDEDLDVLLSQSAFPPTNFNTETIPQEAYMDIKKELSNFGLDTSSYAPIVDLTDDGEPKLDWIIDFDEFEIDNHWETDAVLDQQYAENEEFVNETAPERVAEDSTEVNAEMSDSDSDVVRKPAGGIKKRRYSRIVSESESDGYDSDAIEVLIEKYLPKTSANINKKQKEPKSRRQQQSDSSDEEDDDEFEPLRKVGKLKTGSNFVESRMDKKGIQLELAKRQKLNKRKKPKIQPVTNVDLLDKQTREYILKQRKEKLKKLCATNTEEADANKEEAARSKDGDVVHKGTVKVKVSDGRGAFLCQQTDSTVARLPATKYKKPPIIEPLYKPKKVRTAHIRTNDTSVQVCNNRPSTSATSLPISPSQLRIPAFLSPPPKPPSFIRPNFQQPPTALHPAINAIIHWNCLSFFENPNKQAGLIPGLKDGAAASLRHTKTFYESYEEYRDVVYPLMLIEMWVNVYEDWCKNGETAQKFSAKIVDIDFHPTFARFKCKTYTTAANVGRCFFNSKVLLIGEVKSSDRVNSKGKLAPLILYIEHSQKEPIHPSDTSIFDRTADFVLNFTFITQEITFKIDRSEPISCKYLTNACTYMRPFDAVHYLQHSPLMKTILNPKIEKYDISQHNINYDTPMYTEGRHSSYIRENPDVTLNESQRRAVLEAAYVASRPGPLFYLIEGPPGTGKTTVITQILKQLLFHKEGHEQVCILLVAPSNGAIDNLLLKILQIKKRLFNDKKYSFKVIRIGNEEQMHPAVKQYYIENYAMLALGQIICNENRANTEEYAVLREESRDLKKQFVHNATNGVLTSYKLSYRLQTFARKKLGSLFNKRLAAQKNLIINQSHIICTTLNSCYRLTKYGDIPLNNRVTCCIVDEATQSLEQDTLIPLMLGINNMILVGDPQQLPGVCHSPIARSYGHGQSLFARLKQRLTEQMAAQPENSRNKNFIQFLDTQYRMHPDISYFPNHAFYNGLLKDAPYLLSPPPLANNDQSSSSSRQPRPCPAPLRKLRPYLVIRQSERELFPSQQYGNKSEVELVAGLYREIGRIIGNRDHGIFTVGIITPYNGQKVMIQNCIAEMNIGIEHGLDLTVSTVDGVQGQEKDIIIVSNVRMHGNSFIENENRLNVALTRAKYVLYIVGSDNLFEESDWFREIERDAKSRNLQATVPNSAFVRDAILQPLQ